MALETELKLSFPPQALAQIQQHPLISATRKLGRAQTLENTYFDTPDLMLGTYRVALRTRRIGRQWLQTVKCAASSSGGLSARPEWEQAFNGQFDFSAVDDEHTRSLLESHAGDIVPLFATVFRRETREYAPRAGLRILIMIDSGSVQASGREAPISELELELAEGEASDLIDFALQLAADLPLMPEDASKAERGYSLFHNTAPRAQRSRRADLQPEMSLHSAFMRLALEQLRCWQANALGALQFEDPEFVHQLRVALRRLRTLLRIFAAHLPLGFAGHWQLQLGQLANDIGQARDLDVLHHSVLAAPLSAPGAPDCQTLLAQLDAAARSAREQARRSLQAATSRVLLLQFLRALHTLPAMDQQQHLQEFARHSLRQLHQRACKRLASARDSQQEADLHRLRIACKRLRYASEFFASLFGKHTLNTHLRALAQVLEQLGEINDISVGRARLQDWQSAHPQLAASITWVGGWHAAQAERRARRAIKTAAECLDAEALWKKCRNAKQAK